jgi:hypothetical protein
LRLTKDNKLKLNVFGAEAQTFTVVINASSSHVYADEALVTPQPIVQTLDEIGEKNVTITSPTKTIYDFNDIESTHWASPAIEWALTQDLISGYEDGSFRTEKKLTDAEFAALFARYASNTNKLFFSADTLTKHWSKYYYQSLDEFMLPFRGYYSDEIKDMEISRGQIAQIIAANYGFNLTEKQAIYFMYEND